MADAPDLPDLPRPSQLWKHLDAEKKRLAADAFWRDEHAANEQAEAIGLIAQRIKFRLKSVVGLPVVVVCGCSVPHSRKPDRPPPLPSRSS